MLFRRSSSLPLVVTLLVGGGLAIAGDFDNQRSFSYVGYLEDGSVPVNGDKAMQFALFSSQGAATACQTIAKDGVTVEAGTFGVVLEQIADGCTTSGALYLEIGVAEAGTTDYIAVGGRQQVTGVPFAMGASGEDGLVAGRGDVVFLDGNNSNNANAQVVMQPNDGASGVSVKTFTNPPDGEPIFRVLSSGNAERLRVEHFGETYTDNDFRASGGITAEDTLTVTNHTNLDSTVTIDGLTSHNADVDVKTHSLLFTDTQNSSTQVELTANDSTYDEAGLSVRALTNPTSGTPIFRVLSEGGAERLRVEHDGETFVDQDFTASGNISFGSLSGFTISGEYSAVQNNSAGSDYDTMTSTSTSICFLVRVDVEDTDGNGEIAGCRIDSNNGNWRLQAYLRENNDADVWCEARCLSWN